MIDIIQLRHKDLQIQMDLEVSKLKVVHVNEKSNHHDVFNLIIGGWSYSHTAWVKQCVGW